MFPRWVNEDERLVVLRFGRTGRDGVRGPGRVWLLLPGIVDIGKRVSLRDRSTTAAAGMRDGTAVRATANWRVEDPLKSVVNVASADASLESLLNAALRDAIDGLSPADLRLRRSEIEPQLRASIAAAAARFGVAVSALTVDVE